MLDKIYRRQKNYDKISGNTISIGITFIFLILLFILFYDYLIESLGFQNFIISIIFSAIIFYFIIYSNMFKSLDKIKKSKNFNKKR